MGEAEFIERLILEGAVEVSGIDSKTGEFLYNFTPKLEELYPELHRINLKYFEEMTLSLWEKGFLNIDMLSSSPLVSLNEKALDEEARKELSQEELASLDMIIAAMRDK